MNACWHIARVRVNSGCDRPEAEDFDVREYPRDEVNRLTADLRERIGGTEVDSLGRVGGHRDGTTQTAVRCDYDHNAQFTKSDLVEACENARLARERLDDAQNQAHRAFFALITIG